MVNVPRHPDHQVIVTMAEHLQRTKSNSLITMIRDEDVHSGHIFNSGVASDTSKNNSNIYDTLIVFHDEYASQPMYNNYKRFVSNGGTIIFVDANVFIAEVDYNKSNHTITLVKGHTWEFDGKSARKSVDKRWFNENKDWVGSNFLVSGLRDKIYFLNNPFNYTHFEENYVNNPQNKILLDYDAVVPKNSVYAGFHVASYELSYRKGKVIMTGLYGQTLISNKLFLKMLDS
jgi:ketopantoate reductase